ncbi:MAG: hypothetical protein HFH14_03500 [Lachnospiraceae bacterium]|nr:hypothetical protein [Lachnospiraceae bacterium]
MFDGSLIGNIISVLYYLLFQICGCFMMNRILAKERFSAVFRMLMGSISGTLALQWCPVLFALVFGFNIASHIAGLCLWAAFCFGAWRLAGAPKAQGGRPYADRKEWIRFIKENPCIILMSLVFIYFTYCLLSHTIPIHWDGSMHTGQSTYGDMNLHLSFITSIANQSNFPPDYPILPGTRLSYPFLCDSISSNLYIWGSSLRFAYIFPMLVALCQVMGGFYCLIKYWFGRSITAMIAWVMFFIDGGLGFVYYTNAENISKIFTEFYYTPTSRGDLNFRWAQIITDMLIPQRSTLFGWAILFPLLAFFLYAVRNRSRLCFAIAGVIAGALPMIHTHSFLGFGLVCTMWLIFDCREMCGGKERKAYGLLAALPLGLAFFSILQLAEWRDESTSKNGFVILGIGVALLFVYIMVCLFRVIRSKQLVRLLSTWGLFLAIIILLAFPQLVTWTFGQAGSEGFVRGHFNWQNTGDQYIWFYIKNIGVTFIFFLIGYFFAGKKNLRIASPLLLIYFIAELISFQPLEYDNNKLFFVAFIFICGISADFITKLFLKRWNIVCKALAASALIFFGVISALLSLGREWVSDYELYSASSVEACRFIEKNVPADSVILTATNHNNAVAALTGRSVFCSSPTFLWTHGLDYLGREEKLPSMYSDPVSNYDLFKTYNVGYIYVSGNETGSYTVNFEGIAQIADCIYNDGSVLIFKVK